LHNLLFLDLHDNIIHFLDKTIRLTLSNLHTKSRIYPTTWHNRSTTTAAFGDNASKMDSFNVNLGSNPFECTCEKETVPMLEWLQTSVFVIREQNTYKCALEDITIDISYSGPSKLKELCDYKKLMGILTKVIPTLAGSGVILCVGIVLFCRRRRRIKLHEDFLQELKGLAFANKFLVFLSFCSEDMEFVSNYVAKPLQDALTEITKLERNFVCVGDREFRLGLMVHDEVMRCMEQSFVVMFIISETFCKKDWCKMEVGEAYDQRKPMIMFMKERVATSKMPKILQRIFKRYTHASWVNDDNGGHCEPNMQIICESIIEMARKNVPTQKELINVEETLF